MTAVGVVFWLSVLVPFYAYVGYPLAIYAMARLRPRRRHGDGGDPTGRVSVVLVVHDEQAHIEAKLRSVLASDYPRELLEVLVASDGSRDRTEEMVQSFQSEGVRLLSLPGPRGKIASLNQAVPLATGEILVLTDARQRISRGAIAALVAHFDDPAVGAVSGELQLTARDDGAKASGVGAYWRYEKFLRRTESRFDSTVGATGALYAVRRDLFRPLDPRLILDDVAIPMDVVLAGYRVSFEPRAEAFDLIDEARRELKRKVRTLAGNLQLVRLKPELLNPFANRLFWQFVSHKLTRLIVPFCLLLALASSFVLGLEGGGFYRAVALAQALFYTLALVGAALPSASRVSRVTRLPYAFVLLNVASAVAWVNYFRGAERADWKREPTAHLENERIGGT